MLHEFLEVNSNYTTWFNRMAEYGFAEGVDFITCFPNLESELHGGQNKQDHALKLDMAKEIAMIQKNEKGKQARKYFIEIEKEYNSPEKIMARALQIANKELSTLKIEMQKKDEKIEQDKPKVIFADAVASSQTSILIGELAKILKQNGYNTGQNRLFEELRNTGFLMKYGDSKNMPTQRAMEMGLFEIKETTINNPDGSIRITKTPKVTGKGQQYFINMFLQK